MSESFAAQDPGERFDIVLYDGTPTGRTKPRAAVHRDGDWHRSIHVWVAGTDADGEAFLLVQRRNVWKDTWPGYLDVTVGGHYRSGETLAETIRETEEEIGVSVAVDELRALGVRVSVSEDDGVVDHELQDVFLLISDRPLSDYRPDSAELAELIQIPLASAIALCAGTVEAIEATSLSASTGEISTVLIRQSDFIPAIDRYFYRVAIAVSAVMSGAEHVAV